MAWLLNTNVLSEGRKPRPDPRVTAFVTKQPLNQLFISVVNLAEIRFAIENRSAIPLWRLIQSKHSQHAYPRTHKTCHTVREDPVFVFGDGSDYLTFVHIDILPIYNTCTGREIRSSVVLDE